MEPVDYEWYGIDVPESFPDPINQKYWAVFLKEGVAEFDLKHYKADVKEWFGGIHNIE